MKWDAFVHFKGKIPL